MSNELINSIVLDQVVRQQEQMDGLKKLIDAYVQREKNLMAALMASTKLSDNLYSKGHRLAFVLQCILLATDSDLAAISKYWDEAHAAIEEWRK